ncbi:DUF2071 domain-containing protein [Halpernia frigidisoli]|uniref:Uncharacterized conserved protein (COG2071) n=1 Tax=Halpernia frigidisoli TaxID=1125876 RepID=A0A1I3GR88_9FLAO|nr:DUF2071 domain-containing protein [Halpernia frigidisoli]SFI26055.1 Uncharacterized conserved protein (COG2071) [Halpernia frigidisoli]
MIKIPTIHGFIDRRILINYTADPEVVKKIIPHPFRPKLYKNKAIVGICLIRLKNIKPKGLPDFLGINSENAAHRIAVEWDENGKTKSGIYIPRRDTSLKLNTLAGGRIFPGKHHFANFNVLQKDNSYHVAFKSSDETEISVDAQETNLFPNDSIFNNLENASKFFEEGDLGFSPNKEKLEGLRLKVYNWKATSLKVSNVKSSFFYNEEIFPKGSVNFDHALLMKNIEHEWKLEPSK